ncbi:MAG: SH3 domain-containing protein [Thermomicrobiales bacterium]
MRRIVNVRLALVGLVAVLVASAVPVPTGASHAWNNYHWGQRTYPANGPFELVVAESLATSDAGRNWDGLFAGGGVDGTAVLADWTYSGVVYPIHGLANDSRSSRRVCQAIAGTVRLCNYRYGVNGWLGLASVWISGGHIVQSTVKLNDSYLDHPYFSDVVRQQVLCQELGHGFGLHHQYQPGNSCMNDSVYSYAHPNLHDYEQLAAIYQHGSSSGERVTASGSEIFSAAQSAPPDPVGSPIGGSSEIVVDLGGDQFLVSLVLWAPPEVLDLDLDLDALLGDVTGSLIPVLDDVTGAVVSVLDIGVIVVVAVDGVNLRAEPSPDAQILTVLGVGTELTVIGLPVEAEGYVWVPVQDAAGTTGFVAADLVEILS